MTGYTNIAVLFTVTHQAECLPEDQPVLFSNNSAQYAPSIELKRMQKNIFFVIRHFIFGNKMYREKEHINSINKSLFKENKISHSYMF